MHTDREVMGPELKESDNVMVQYFCQIKYTEFW